jgi:uncharacterized protein (DUF1015 family)
VAVPRFEPFAGVLYADTVDLGDMIAPPYDVIDAEARAALVARSPYNAVRLELPEGGADRYDRAAALRDEWLRDQVLVPDPEPAFYVYRMGYKDAAGRARQTAGVIGALELSRPGEGAILPHERTMPKPKSDRLDLLRASRMNLSPVWGLSLAEGLSALCELPGPPDARATDDDGVHHRLWRIEQPGVVEAIAAAVSSAPVVIADGHHRYETALAYREERNGAPGADRLMVYVVELAAEQLDVRPIHRLVTSVPAGVDLVDALSARFEVFETAPAIDTLPARMLDAGALALLTDAGAFLLRPTGGAGDATDSELLGDALPDGVELEYDHDPAKIAALVAKGDAAAGILLRAPTVAQISAAAHAGRRLPEKTSFFSPKPRTGLVFRSV